MNKTIMKRERRRTIEVMELETKPEKETEASLESEGLKTVFERV